MIPDLRRLPLALASSAGKFFIDEESRSRLDKVIKFNILTERLAGIKPQAAVRFIKNNNETTTISI